MSPRILWPLLLCGSTTLLAAVCEARSPPHTVALVELYTSEGCSSCPPADRWLAELGRHYSPQQMVPLALHVDYWDYIGWKDPFAQAQFTSRQQWLTRISASPTPYTPEVFIGMRELRHWHAPQAAAQRIKAINARPARAALELKMSANGQDKLDLEVQASNGSGNSAQLVVVLYENGLSSKVRAGENGGATLSHAHVARFATPAIHLDPATDRAHWKQTLPMPAHWQRRQLGLAAYVQDATSGEILQAAALPACLN